MLPLQSKRKNMSEDVKTARRELPEGFKKRLMSEPELDGPALIKALSETEPEVGVRFNLRKSGSRPQWALDGEKVPWCGDAILLSQRPEFTLEPLMHAGAFYVQDSSSTIHQTIISKLVGDKDVCVLDLCAAPGGKSTAALAALSESSMLVANEYLPQRAIVLAENITKWGTSNVVVTSADSSKFAKLGAMFDLVILDAPCSGEGMMRKDKKAIEQWGNGLVQSCAQLQKEIADNAVQALKPGGILIYSTCTFSRSENEDMVAYLVDEYGMESIDLSLETFGIAKGWGKQFSYRFMPHITRGEGLFVAALRLTDDGTTIKPRKKKSKLKPIKSKDVPQWVENQESYQVVEFGENITFLRDDVLDMVERLQDAGIRILQSGITIGQRKGRDIIPSEGLALSVLLRANAFPDVPLKLEDALNYLRRETLVLPAETPRGFVTVSYEGRRLGFMKNLGNRANNLFPVAWKIKYK